MHIAIFGAGSVGGYAGGMLARGGLDVTLVDGWPAHVDAIKARGLRLYGTQGEFLVQPRALHMHEVHQLARHPVDVAILAVKSYDTAWLATLVQDYLSPAGVVVSMQNGMNEETIARILGWERVLGCVLNTIGVEATGPGEILRWMTPAPAGYAVFRVGEAHGATTERATAIAAALGHCDEATVTSNLWGERWSKLVNNAMASGIGPLTGFSIPDMLAHPLTRPLCLDVAREAIRIGRTSGFRLEKICSTPIDTWLSDAADAQQQLDAGLAAYEARLGPEGQASTLHDIRRGRRTEIAFINGLVARQAAKIGLEAPLNAALTAQVQRLERGEITQGLEALDPVIAAWRRN